MATEICGTTASGRAHARISHTEWLHRGSLRSPLTGKSTLNLLELSQSKTRYHKVSDDPAAIVTLFADVVEGASASAGADRSRSGRQIVWILTQICRCWSKDVHPAAPVPASPRGTH